MSLLQEKEASDSQSISFNRIPIIDLTNMKSSDVNLRQALGKEIRDACINVGFFYGIRQVPTPSMTHWKELRSSLLSLESKMKLDKKKIANFRGYTARLDGENNAGDLRPEEFLFGWEELDIKSDANVWPPKAEASNFREAVLNYYHAAVHLGRLILPLFALALELPENYFEDKTKDTTAVATVLNYPPQTSQVDSPVIQLVAHSDWTASLLRLQPEIQALQVLNADGQWVNAPPIDGTLVIKYVLPSPSYAAK
ncbi:hypothetical protein AX14_013046 [Amanita brunnescens Koide BX004]|nr:hypothetical protein AX14_013046 [Amanita brunnescens Koide BX004]